MSLTHKELEAKFYLLDLERLQKTLERLGAVLVQPRTHEYNLRFDTPSGILTRSRQVLRLRKDHTNWLTYKSPGELSEGVSSRTEIEFTVGDFENTQALLEALGYQVSMIYEKYRTAFKLGDTLVTLDEMPFGDFAEIEGQGGDTIRATCNQLGLVWETRTLLSYAALFRNVQQNLALSFRDLTFENFTLIKVKPSHLELAPADIAGSK